MHSRIVCTSDIELDGKRQYAFRRIRLHVTLLYSSFAPDVLSRLIRFNYSTLSMRCTRSWGGGGDLYFKQRKLVKTKCDYANHSYVKLKLEIRAFKNNVTVVV
jgi:hypothetical protein